MITVLRTIEWNSTRWWLVEWTRTDFLQMKGRFVRPLNSKEKVDAECEAKLQGWL